MGEVFRATDTKLGRDMAIKVLPTEVSRGLERLARSRREATLLAALKNRHNAAMTTQERATVPARQPDRRRHPRARLETSMSLGIA